MQPLILESRRDLPLLLTVSTKRRKSIPQYTGGDPPPPPSPILFSDFPAIRIIFGGNLNKIGTSIRSPVSTSRVECSGINRGLALVKLVWYVKELLSSIWDIYEKNSKIRHIVYKPFRSDLVSKPQRLYPLVKSCLEIILNKISFW